MCCLCAGAYQAHEELCRLFDEETADGCEMNRNSDLLDKVVAASPPLFKKAASAICSQVVASHLSAKGNRIQMQVILSL